MGPGLPNSVVAIYDVDERCANIDFTVTVFFFAPCPRGLESVLVAELEQLGATFVQAHAGGVRFQGDWRLCYGANLESRIASRILWRVASEHYASEADVYNIARTLPWNEWFKSSYTIRVNVAARKCPLRSLDFVTLKIKDAVCDTFRAAEGTRPSVDTARPDIRIYGFLDAQEFSLYLDTSGDALFKRGLRKTSGEAPIRENLAAGILDLAGWQPGTPLLDPMCGSGTFLLEAAQIALNIAPGLGRDFAFQKLLNFDNGQWDQLKDAALIRQKQKAPQPIFGSDLYGDALAAARENISAAAFAEVITLKQANVLEISAPTPAGIIVTNPPYGVRIGERQPLDELYPKLGDVLKKKFSGWNAYIMTADPLLPKLIRLTPSRRIPLFNGALECRLLEYKIVAGGMRKMKTDNKQTVLDASQADGSRVIID